MNNYRWQVRKSPFVDRWMSFQANGWVDLHKGALVAVLTYHETQAEAMAATCKKIRRYGR